MSHLRWYGRIAVVVLLGVNLFYVHGCLKMYDMLGAICENKEQCNGLDCIQNRCIRSVATTNQNNQNHANTNNQNNQNQNNNQNNIKENPVGLEPQEESQGQEEPAEKEVLREADPEAGPETGLEAGPETGLEAGPETGLEAGPEESMSPDDGGMAMLAKFSDPCSPAQPCELLKVPPQLSHLQLFCAKARKEASRDTCVVSGCKNDQDCREFCATHQLCSQYLSKVTPRCLQAGSTAVCLWDNCPIGDQTACFPGWECLQGSVGPPACFPK